MRTRIVLVTAMIAMAGARTVLGQALGPKDGRGLAPTDLERVKVGDLAPDFTLESRDGRRVTLSDYRGAKNVVLVFYRGWW